MEYTLDYFINLFDNIQEEHFSLSTELNPTDAYELLNEDEHEALWRIIKPWGILTDINDGVNGYDFYGDTIKERVLNFLHYIKKNRIQYLHY